MSDNFNIDILSYIFIYIHKYDRSQLCYVCRHYYKSIQYLNDIELQKLKKLMDQVSIEETINETIKYYPRDITLSLINDHKYISSKSLDILYPDNRINLHIKNEVKLHEDLSFLRRTIKFTINGENNTVRETFIKNELISYSRENDNYIVEFKLIKGNLRKIIRHNKDGTVIVNTYDKKLCDIRNVYSERQLENIINSLNNDINNTIYSQTDHCRQRKSYNYDTMNVKELKSLCKELGLINYSKLNRNSIIQLIKNNR